MSRKVECPACGSYTSTAALAFDQGDPCPYCGLPADAWREVLDARKRGADAELTEKYTAAVLRATKAEGEAQRLSALLEQVRQALAEAGQA